MCEVKVKCILWAQKSFIWCVYDSVCATYNSRVIFNFKKNT